MLLQRGVEVSDAATLALNNTLPSIDSQRPSRVWTLLATATWVCSLGSPARLSGWVNPHTGLPIARVFTACVAHRILESAGGT